LELLHLNVPYAKNRLVGEYLAGEGSFFHYRDWKGSESRRRYRELMQRRFQREGLKNCIEKYMKQFSPFLPSAVEKNLEKLADPRSAVVIAGQQAGLLTGPLYTIHKILSVLSLAREKERELGVPVVPVFWIAGEDHDIGEVNHVYYLDKGKLKKHIYRQKHPLDKQMVSKRPVEGEEIRRWYREWLKHFGETEHTKAVLAFLDGLTERVTTYTEFFAAIILHFFGKYGLLFIDSAYPELRRLEGEYFGRILDAGPRLADALADQQNLLQQMGFEKMIDTKADCLHLFYEQDGNRVLLYFDREKDAAFGERVKFSLEELRSVAEHHPEKLSNNVVTRPLMQEWLFPVLAFIGGPGEIAYWAELKKIFELFGMNMPPVVPRIQITLIERNIASDLEDLSLSLEKVLTQGVEEELEERINRLKDREFLGFVAEKREEIFRIYREVAGYALAKDKGLAEIVEKNSRIVLSQLDYLQSKAEQSMLRKHGELLGKYMRIENFLHPLGGFQERCWNVFYFINLYGFSLIDELMELPLDFSGRHHAVKL